MGTFGNALFSLLLLFSFFFSFCPPTLGLLTRPAVPCCSAAPLIASAPPHSASQHNHDHVDPLSAGGGPASRPLRQLLFGGEVSGGVENAASHGGCGDHRPERCALAALLPRRPGETQLPQRSHLPVVGSCFSCSVSLYSGWNPARVAF